MRQSHKNVWRERHVDQASHCPRRLSRRHGIANIRPRGPGHRPERADQDRLPAGADRPVSSSTGVGINRGVQLAVEEINKAGGIKGRKIELISRDTQSDPTKAVNAVAELTQRAKVSMIWGPVNSGEALAATPLIARDKVPMLHPCWVDELIDVKKYPMAFRIAPTNTQVGDGANHYVVERAEAEEGRGDQRHHRLRHGLGQHLRADAEGDGRRGGLHQPRRRGEPRPQARAAAHAERRRPGDHAVERQRRLPVAHPATRAAPWAGTCRSSARRRSGSGQTKALLEKPENWNKVYSNNFRKCCYVNGKLPPRAAEFVERLKKAKIEFADTLLWWVALGWDGAMMMADDLQDRRHQERRHRRLHGTRSRAGRASTAPSPGRRSSTTASPTRRS